MITNQKAVRTAAVAMAMAIQAQYARADYPDFDYEVGNTDIWDGNNAMEESAINDVGDYGTYLSVYGPGDHYHTVNPLSYGNDVHVTVNVPGGWTWSFSISPNVSLADVGVTLLFGISEGIAGTVDYRFVFDGWNSPGSVSANIGYTHDDFEVTNATTSGTAYHGNYQDSFGGTLKSVDVTVWIWC